MRILLTNDDGIDAEGLAILAEAAHALTDDVWTVAPATEQSGQSRAVSLVNPLRIAKLDEKRFAVSGTPADCIAAAMGSILDERPDLVLSGINKGMNLADDIPYSGTVGAAMEAAQLHIPAIGLSQAYRTGHPDSPEDMWDAAKAHCLSTIKTLITLERDPRMILNVNFPPFPADRVTGTAITRQGRRAEHSVLTQEVTDQRGNPCHWVRFHRRLDNPPVDTDLGAVAAAQISVTPLLPDMTARDALDGLSRAIKGDGA